MTSVSQPAPVSSSTSNTSQPQSQSYASTTKKAALSPSSATGSSTQPPAVAVSNGPPVQHGKNSSISPVNGRAAIPPAVPVVSSVGGSSIVNGSTASADHMRKSSVTIAAGNGGYLNGGAAGQKSGIQFGSITDSPSVSHSVRQPSHATPSAPINIPGRGTSPAQSPSPIPQPVASGGPRPPLGLPGNNLTFGSLPGDGDRHASRPQSIHGPIPPTSQHDHNRRDSADINHGGPPMRGGYPNQGGRGNGGRGGNYNNNNFPPQQMNYNQGSQQYRGPPSGGRGGMPPYSNQNRSMAPFPNSPHQAARSPALSHSIPGTPNMNQSMPMQPQPPYGPYPPQQHFMAGPQGYYHQPQFGVPPQFAMYPGMQYMPGIPGQPQSPQPPYQQPYVPGQYNHSQPQPMSRSASQRSDRPASSLGQPQTPSMPSTHLQASQTKPNVPPSSPAFQRTTRKSAAIVIKNPEGDVIQLPQTKAPASPAPSNRSKSPPVATPTPPPKSNTPQQTGRTDSPAKNPEQVRLEFKEAMKKKVMEADVKPEAKPESTKPSEPLVVGSSAIRDAKDEDSGKVDAAKAAEEEARAAEEAKAAAEAKARQEEEDRIEREIQEMEEAEARRYEEEQKMNAKRAAEKAAAKKAQEDKERFEEEEYNRTLKEKELEMERLEDEKERKRQEADAKAAGSDSQPKSAAQHDSKNDSDDVEADDKDTDAKNDTTTPSALASKLSNLSLGERKGSPTTDDSMGPPPKVVGRGSKPAALNLAPLNTKPVDPPQPSAALQSLKSARFLTVLNESIYPPNISSPNPALNSAVTSKGKSFKYDKEFLLQFQKVFTEKPSVEFESQIKALIGDSDGGSARANSARTPGGMGPRQNSNRNAPATFAAMGSFGAPGNGKTLPAGTTSADRFAMSQGTLPRPTMNNPMASFNRPGGSFPGNPMTRVPSTTSMGNMPQSPRNKNNSGRQNSSRYKDSKQEAQAAKTMPLTAGIEVKPIQVSATGWKPRSIVGASSVTGAAGPAPGDSGNAGHMQPDMVQRKVKAALNKMTPEKFDKIADQILAIAAQSKDEADGRTLRQVIQLTFEKATDEAHWASMYAKFCKRMLETMSPDIKDESILDKNGNVVSGGNLFRKYLLNRCQEEFERGWKMDLGEKPEGEEGEAKSEEAAMLSDAYYIAAAAKRRGLGLVQFIGELYKLGMLTERIMHECVKKLVDYTGVPDEAEVESLTKLLKTIGGNLDSTEKGKPMMDIYFTRIQTMIDTPELPSRLKFMLMDIVDLRKKRWHSKEDNKGPKTLDEIRAEAEVNAQQKAAENARGSQRGGGSGRMQMGRGDSRNFSGGYGNQPPVDYSKNTVATDDLRRLGSKANRNSGAAMSFGPTSMFSSRSNSGRKLGPGGSLSRGAEDSGASSRTGTPPHKEKEPSSANAFSLLGELNDSGETENPASPPSVAASPALSKASPAKEGASEKSSDS